MTRDAGIWVIGYGSLIFKPPPHTSIKLNGYLNGYIRRFWQSSSDHRGTPESPGRVVTILPLADLKSHERFHDDLHMYELSGIASHQESEILLNNIATNLDSKNNEISDIRKKVSELKPSDLKVWGSAYYIPAENVQEVTEYLDIREQDGYTSHTVKFYIELSKQQKMDPELQKIVSVLSRDPVGDYYIESKIYIGTIENDSFVGPENISKTAEVIKNSRGPSGENSEYLIKLCHAVRELDKDSRSRDYYLEDLVKSVNS